LFAGICFYLFAGICVCFVWFESDSFLQLIRQGKIMKQLNWSFFPVLV